MLVRQSNLLALTAVLPLALASEVYAQSWIPRGGGCANSSGQPASLFPGSNMRAGNENFLVVGMDLPAGAPTVAVIGASHTPVSGVYLGLCEITVGGDVATAAMMPSTQEGLQTFSMALPPSSEGVFMGMQMAYIDPATSDLLLSNGIDIVVQPSIDWSQVGGSDPGEGDGEHEVVVNPLQEGTWHEMVDNEDQIHIAGSHNLNGNNSAHSGAFVYMGPTAAIGHLSVYAEDSHTANILESDSKLVFENEWLYEPNAGVEDPHPTASASGNMNMSGKGLVGGWNATCYMKAGYVTEISPLVPPTSVNITFAGAMSTQTISIGGVDIPLGVWGPDGSADAASAPMSGPTEPTGLVRTTVNANFSASLGASTVLFSASSSSVDLEGVVKTELTLGDDPD